MSKSSTSATTTPPRDGAFMSIPEGADYLRLSRSSMFRLMRRKEVAVIRIGGRTLLRRGDLDALAARHLEPAA